MRYESMGRNQRRVLNVPQLVGGLNTSTDAALIEDDEVCDICNLTVDHGALVTREAVRTVSDAPLIAPKGNLVTVDTVMRQTIDIDGEPCAVVLTAASDSYNVSEVSVQLVTMNGTCLESYTLPISGSEHRFAVVPCDKEVYGGSFLLFHRGDIYVPHKESGVMMKIGDEYAYVPLVMVNGKSVLAPEGECPDVRLSQGEMHEGFNVLTKRYRAAFTPSVSEPECSECYVMPTTLAVGSEVTMDAVTANGRVRLFLTVGEGAEEFQIGENTYSVFANTAGDIGITPALPVSGIQNTVVFTCEREVGGEQVLFGVSHAVWFGGTDNDRIGARLFLANGERSELIWSEGHHPFYFPENNRMVIGDLSQRITALEKQKDMLVIFKERELYYTTCVKKEITAKTTVSDLSSAQSTLPLTQLSANIGCRCPRTISLCHDRLVWLDQDARVYMLALSYGGSERNVCEIGAKIRPYLLEHTTVSQRKYASAADHKGRYRLMIGNRMVEFDYRANNLVGVSGERVADRIAWFAHRFDGFHEAASQAIVSDGADKAIVISTSVVYPVYKIVRTAYVFDSTSASDWYAEWNYNLERTVIEQPITTTLTTKTYDMGHIDAYKRIGAVFAMLKSENARVRFIADGDTPPVGIPHQSDDLHAHMLLPCIKRCRTLAIKIDAIGNLCLGSIRVPYKLFGMVK